MDDYELRQMAKDHTMKEGLDSLEFYDQVQSDQDPNEPEPTHPEPPG